MKYPCLINKKMCKTPIVITINQEGLSEDGEPITDCTIDTFCNYQDKAKTTLTAEQKLVTIEGTAMLPGDIAPDIANISNGYAVVNGIKRTIYRGTKARNPDNTVNYTKLELV